MRNERDRSVATNLKKTVAGCFRLVFILVLTWIIGNWSCLLEGRNARDAAVEVAQRYMAPREARLFSATESKSEYVFPVGESHRFDIHDGETTVATVSVVSFLGLGWQERYFSKSGV